MNHTDEGIDVGMTGKEDVVWVPEIYSALTVKIAGKNLIVHENGIVLSGTGHEFGHIHKKETVFCDFCGTQFEKKNYRQRFCSHACKGFAKRV